jgi:hypothetical protein
LLLQISTDGNCAPLSQAEKSAQLWRVLSGQAAYAHEPAQTTNTPEKTKAKTETKTLERKNHANQTISN